MGATFELEVATPERLLVREKVSEAQIPAANGFLGVLPDHSPLLSELGAGDLSYVADGHRRDIAVSGGWVEVRPERVRVLAVVAEHANEVDVARAMRSLERAQERLAATVGAVDVARALNAMRRAQARLAAAERK